MTPYDPTTFDDYSKNYLHFFHFVLQEKYDLEY